MCGAARPASMAARASSGLSPRVWGSPVQRFPPPVDHRSIPTCVGQPFRLEQGRRFHRVYPHVCGAAPQAQERYRRVLGLSPRVWGSRTTTICADASHRSIPTCVGQPHFGHCKSHKIRSIPTCVGQPGAATGTEEVGPVYPHVCGAAK